MKQEKDPIETALSYTFAFIVVAGVLLSFVEIFVFNPHAPTNTTMHQPEPTEQYADSLVCPD